MSIIVILNSAFHLILLNDMASLLHYLGVNLVDIADPHFEGELNGSVTSAINMQSAHIVHDKPKLWCVETDIMK